MVAAIASAVILLRLVYDRALESSQSQWSTTQIGSDAVPPVKGFISVE